MKKIKMNRTVKKFMPIIIIAAFIIIPTIISLSIGQSFTGTGSVIQVEVDAVVTDNITEELALTGTVESEKVSILFTPVNGTVDSCNVKVGQAVQEGELLVQFDLEELERSYQQSELSYLQSTSEYEATVESNNQLVSDAAKAASEVSKLESQVDSLEANIVSYGDKVDQYSLQQSELLLEKTGLEASVDELKVKMDGTTDEAELAEFIIEMNDLEVQLEVVLTELEEISAEISSYSEKLEIATSDLSEATMSLAENEAIAASGDNAMSAAQLAALELSNELVELESLDADELYEKGKEGIIAPYDGVISAVNILEGSQVSQGMELITIASNTDVCVEIEVSTSDYDKLTIGDKAEIEIKGYIYEGEVSEISQIVTTNAAGTKVVEVTVDILDGDENVFLGVDTKTTIITETKEDVICISSSVINTSTEGDFVYVLEDGIVIKKNIEIGIAVLDKVEIISGLEVGDWVISDMTTVLYEGMAAEAKSE